MCGSQNDQRVPDLCLLEIMRLDFKGLQPGKLAVYYIRNVNAGDLGSRSQGFTSVFSMRRLGLTELWASNPQAARLGGLPGGGSCLKGDWVQSFLKSVLLSTRSVRHPWLALCGKRPGALFFSFFFFDL